MQVSKELIRFFDGPLCVGVARDKRLLTLQTRKATLLAINKAKNYEGVLVHVHVLGFVFTNLLILRAMRTQKRGCIPGNILISRL